ncbi:MAG: hypothetical protein QGI70_12175, partial [Paracoccaceae bacterium]|nr:hypothetical protein [Paracoccaceae bacterium]
MGLPQKVFYSVNEVAARWECSLADIAGWASVGYFDIVTVMSSKKAGGDPRLEGFVCVAVTDVLPILRGYGKAAKKADLGRMRYCNLRSGNFVGDCAVRPCRGMPRQG